MVNHPSQLPDESFDFPYAFELVPDIYSCVTLIQSTIAELPMCFYRELSTGAREEIKAEGSGTVADLWRKPNGHETGYNFIEQVQGALEIYGNAYIYLESFGVSGPPGELYVLASDRVRPILDATGGASAFLLDTGMGAPQRIEGDRMLWIKNYSPNPSSPLGQLGLSPLRVARLAYETQRNMARWHAMFYQKGAAAAGYYSTELPMEKEDKDAAIKELKEQMQGVDKAWDPVLLVGGLKFARAGLTQQEMQFAEGSLRTTEDVLRIFHIPPVVFGIKQGGALGNEGADMEWLLFYQQCIKPRTRRIEEALNELFLPRFGPNIRCEFDFSGVLPFQEVMLKQAQAYVTATGKAIITVEEARVRLGLPEEPEMGELYTPAPPVAPGIVPGKPAEQPGATVDEPVDPEQAKARDRMRAVAARDLGRHERRFRAGMSNYFTRQETRVVDRLREQGHRSFERLIDVDHLLDDSDGDRELARLLIRAVVSERGQEVADELASKVVFSAMNERVDSFVRSKGMVLVSQINQTTRKDLRDTLGEGIANDETMGELIKRVADVYTGRRTGGAATIARTETASAFNFATVEAWKESGVVETKEWLTARDEHVRDAHADVDGQIVGVDDEFELVDSTGTAWLVSYPGEPELPAELVINCRCTLVPGVVKQRDRRAPRLHANGNGKTNLEALTIEEMLQWEKTS
jgi:HK97 family phage portal protein